MNGALTLAQLLHDEAISEGPMYWLLMVANIILVSAMLATLYRLLVGPSLPDRVVALDLLGFFAVGVICIFAMLTAKPVLLVVAIVMALILFIGTAAFALYLERRARP